MSAFIHIKKSNRQKSRLNPLRGLHMPTVVSWLEAGERGEYNNIQWLYRFIEKRDAELRALVRRRRSALQKLDWNIKVVSELPKGASQTQAEAQQVALREAYDRLDNLRAAIGFLAMAEFRGFAHLERHFNDASETVHLEQVPQWHWLRDGMYGDWQYNEDATGVNRGTPIKPENFLIREVEDPIDEIAAIAFLRKSLSQKDWDGFIEAFGIAPLFIEMPPGGASAEDAEEYQEMVEEVIAATQGVLPNGAKVHTVDAGARGNNPFREHLRYQDEQIVMAGTGGLLTMLNDPTGLGSGQSESHQETFDEIAQAEAAVISEIFQKQFDQPILEAQFAGQPPLAYFEIAARDETDVSQLADHAVKFGQAGFAMDADELSEKSGYKLTPRAPVVPPRPFGADESSPLSNRKQPSRLVSMAREELARAQAKALLPIRQRLAEIERMGDEVAQKEALVKLRGDLPSLLKKMNVNPATAKAIEKAMAASFFNGIAEGADQTA